MSFRGQQQSKKPALQILAGCSSTLLQTVVNLQRLEEQTGREEEEESRLG